MSKKIVSIIIMGTMLVGTSASVSASASEVKKTETVFVNLNSGGSAKNITVSDWIHGDSSSLNIEDKSSLEDIKNVKSDDEPSKSGDSLKWNIDNSDIYYQGKSDAKLPVRVYVRYYLDGEVIQADDLVGKSGKVKIELEVKNNMSEYKVIGGVGRHIYTPFSVGSVITLPVDQFKEVKVEGGIVTSEGNNNIIAFAAFPGLKESLDIKDDNLEDLGVNLNDKLVIEAQVNEFSLSPIMIAVTSELPNLDKLDAAKTINELKSSLNELKDGSDKLLDGTNELNEGVTLAKEKLDSGLNMLNTNEMNDTLSLVKNPMNVALSRVLIKDAFYAKDMDTVKAKELLGLLTDKNIENICNLTNNAQNLSKYKNLLEGSANAVNTLKNDKEFNDLMNSILFIESQYVSIPNETKAKIEGLLEIATPENLINAQNLINGCLSLSQDFKPLNDTINQAISMVPGVTAEEKTMNFMNGLKNSLAVTQNLLSDKTAAELSGLEADMTDYASSYLIIKAQLAATYKLGGEAAFNLKKEELKTYVKDRKSTRLNSSH